MSDEANLLGGYLRARRELVTPDQAGIPVLGLRRVPGLRREEVAMLAGISADYYLRLEQGRDRHPSVPVLESLARVLHLDDDATAYLLGLAVIAIFYSSHVPWLPLVIGVVLLAANAVLTRRGVRNAPAYLLGLGAEKPRRARRRPRKENVPAGIAKLVAALPLPAFVEGHYFDVLAANALATAPGAGSQPAARRVPRPRRARALPGLA